MSGSLGPLSDAEKTDVRRYCGYPVYGTGAVDDPYYRFTTTYVQLESHMANLSPAELAVCRSKLASLVTLDAALPAMSDTLVVQQAAVFTRNPRELQDRNRLYSERRRDLCGFLGVPPGPGLSSGGNNLRLVV